jgi:hypothetical protein
VCSSDLASSFVASIQRADLYRKCDREQLDSFHSIGLPYYKSDYSNLNVCVAIHLSVEGHSCDKKAAKGRTKSLDYAAK